MKRRCKNYINGEKRKKKTKKPSTISSLCVVCSKVKISGLGETQKEFL
jgi:hypothetical protein